MKNIFKFLYIEKNNIPISQKINIYKKKLFMINIYIKIALLVVFIIFCKPKLVISLVN